MTDITLTPEEIQKQYDAAMDSVSLLNAGKPSYFTNEQWADCVDRNVEHLRIVVAKDYWTSEDLTPFRTAISTFGD